MNILIAPDKFKGSLGAGQVCDAIAAGVKKKYPNAVVVSIPMADGGEGTCELLTMSSGGKMRPLKVTGPLFETITSEYGLDHSGTMAFIEMAKASGLQLVNPEKRNPLYTTSLGTGELINDALHQGVKKIILGIGGSGTNDGGMGMLDALGFKFIDKQGKTLRPIGENLILIESIREHEVSPRLKEVEFVALCDVDNPLYGERGAAYVYAPQKGANPREVELLDRGLQNFDRVIQKTSGRSANFPGAGAGGGLPGGAKGFLNLTIHRGMDYIIKLTRLEERISESDLIFTGEGKIDSQTLAGKVVMEVARIASRFGKPVVAVCGMCELREIELHKIGISKVISLIDPFTTRDEAMNNADALIRKKVEMSFAI